MPERSQLRTGQAWSGGSKRGGLPRASAGHRAPYERENKPLFAIVACVKASSAVWVHSTIQSLQDTALVRVLLPSLAATINATETDAWRLRLYLCADDDDWLYARAGTQRDIRARMPHWLELRLLKIRAQRQRVPNREAALAAYLDGAEYIHRTNDDIRYFTQGWITTAVGVLRSLDPPNLGVVGPRVYGDGMRAMRLLTLDVVHRTHLELFAEYYPPQLDNWFVDDWISFTCAPAPYIIEPRLAAEKALTRLYARVFTPTRRADTTEKSVRGTKRRALVLYKQKRFPGANWLVSHNFTHGTRYNATTTNRRLMWALIGCGRAVVAERLATGGGRSAQAPSVLPAPAPLAGLSAATTPVQCRAYQKLSKTKSKAPDGAECFPASPVGGMSIRDPAEAYCRITFSCGSSEAACQCGTGTRRLGCS